MRSLELELPANRSRSSSRSQQFARDVVAPRAAAIDESGEFPADVMHAAAGRGLLGVTIPTGVGRAGPRLRQLRAGDRGHRARQRHGRRLAVGHQLARRRTASRTPARDQQRREWLRRLARGDAIGAFALSEPDAGTDAANQQTKAVQDRPTAIASPDERSGSPTPTLRPSAIVFASHAARTARAGRHGVSRADGRAGHHADGARRFARRPRPRLHGPRARSSRSATSRCSAQSTRDSGSRCGRCRAAASRSPRRRSASARRRSPRRSRHAKHARAVRPADRELSSDSVDAGRHGDRARRRRAC